MKELEFQVAAKTARLYGRENFSNAEGAIAELVKNTYDADATACLICFIPRYRTAPDKLSMAEVSYVLTRRPAQRHAYIQDGDGFVMPKNIDYLSREESNQFVSYLVDLWIIDNGTGMSAQAIEDHWMVIGTNNKEKNAISDLGRARTGAKGIGRFALDRLGNSCDLYSSSIAEGATQSIAWRVDWSEFDNENKVLSDIKARLDVEADQLKDVLSFTKDFPPISSAIEGILGRSFNWNTGTAIRIGLLRDEWSPKVIDHLNKTLGALIPPLEQRDLNLLLFDSSSPDRYGVVAPEVLDDYDYKLEANITSTGRVRVNISRNELDHSNLDPELFDRKEMATAPFDKRSFETVMTSYDEEIETLFPGASEQFIQIVDELGPFKVSLMFFKKGSPSRRDSEIYPYRAFQPGPRKAWLEEYGGVKIYRDNFAVRPYGEPDGRAADWLALGKRLAISPVAASRKGWKVGPQNLAGTVTISRKENARLNDQSNREGIIENDFFVVFREIILRVIQIFEDDRSHIHYNIHELYKEKNEDERTKSEGALTATRVVKSPEEATIEDAQQLAKAFVAQQEEIRELKDEQTMLRALATLGTVLVSFSHEMGQLQNTMGSRSNELADILSSYISPDSLMGVGGAFNPYTILGEWEEDDKKVKQWFTFALSSVRADKRRRKKISLREHLKKTRKNWKGFLEPRDIELDFTFAEKEADLVVLAFEIDLDSIFNNLILNSVEALLSGNHTGPRKISIDLSGDGSSARIQYKDNGPGIDPSIKDPASIFKFAVTTKLDGKGEANGTGLGMWILAAVVQTYGGSFKAFKSIDRSGFSMEIYLPTKATN